MGYPTRWGHHSMLARLRIQNRDDPHATCQSDLMGRPFDLNGFPGLKSMWIVSEFHGFCELCGLQPRSETHEFAMAAIAWSWEDLSESYGLAPQRSLGTQRICHKFRKNTQFPDTPTSFLYLNPIISILILYPSHIPQIVWWDWYMN